MGAVYKARQPSLDRFVALKILAPTSAEQPGFAERFTREARALARLSHPNIVAVHDFGTAGNLPYLIMEFVEGTTLRQVERTGRLSSAEALEIVPQICAALQYAHQEGIVHRDIKPENILLDKKGRLKIADFGIAKLVGGAPGGVPLTGARDVVGTPIYMAPEQIEKPQEVDHRADIYSLGVVFYEMLTGELPLGRFQPPSQRVQVDVRLDEVVLRALEKAPERRYQQAGQIKTEVETIAGSPAAAMTPRDAINQAEWSNPRNWSFGLYFSKRDSRKFFIPPPPRGIFSMGPALNLGHWQAVALFTGIPLVCILALAVSPLLVSAWKRNSALPAPVATSATAPPASAAQVLGNDTHGFRPRIRITQADPAQSTLPTQVVEADSASFVTVIQTNTALKGYTITSGIITNGMLVFTNVDTNGRASTVSVSLPATLSFTIPPPDAQPASRTGIIVGLSGKNAVISPQDAIASRTEDAATVSNALASFNTAALQSRLEQARILSNAFASFDKATLQVRLRQAEAKLANAKQLDRIGTATVGEVAQAQDEVEIIQAQLAGDSVRVAQIELNAAQRSLQRVKLMAQIGTAPRSDVEDAKAEVEIRQNELITARALVLTNANGEPFNVTNFHFDDSRLSGPGYDGYFVTNVVLVHTNVDSHGRAITNIVLANVMLVYTNVDSQGRAITNIVLVADTLSSPRRPAFRPGIPGLTPTSCAFV